MKPTIEEKLQATEITEADIQPQGGQPKVSQALTITPMALMQQAIQLGHVDQLEKLMGLYERWEANEARKAFTEAMSAFKSAPPEITKNKHVYYPTKREGGAPMDYWHATLDEVVTKITQGLSQHGLSHRWEVEQPDGGQITVTCILTHSRGHFERTVMRAPKDDSAGKNLIQAVGSTVTYLQRYTLLAATGLAAKNEDDDGRGSTASDKPTLDNVDEIVEFIANCRNRDELGKQFFPNYEKARTFCDKEAMQALIAAKRRKEAEWA